MAHGPVAREARRMTAATFTLYVPPPGTPFWVWHVELSPDAGPLFACVVAGEGWL